MENIEKYIEENIANIKLCKNGNDELVLVDMTTKEELAKGSIKEMLSRSYVQDVINYNLKEKTETVEEPVQEETVEPTEDVDVNSVIDNVIEEDKQEMEEAINEPKEALNKLEESVNRYGETMNKTEESINELEKSINKLEKSVNDAESLEDEQDDLENIPFDDEDVYDEHEIVEEYALEEEKKHKLSSSAKKAIATAIVVVGLGALGIASCNNNNKKALSGDVSSAVLTVVDENANDEKDLPENDTPDNTVDEPEETVEETVEEEPLVPERTLDELYSDSRYTEITEENLTQATNDLVNEFAKHGIEINGQDALYFTALNNITHIAQTNPDLLSQLFGEVDKETVISKAGHVIGQIVTLEVTAKDEQVDWTVALIDDADKKIAAHDMKLIEDCKVIARNEELTNEEKAEEIQGLVQDKFVKPNYDKTVGRDFEDGTHSALTTEDGADFTTDAIFTGVMMGDNELKDYIYKSETMDDLMAISANEDNVSNLFTIIEDCKGKSF